MNSLHIIGAGGHGKVVADIALTRGYSDIVFFADGNTEKECMGFPIVNGTEKVYDYPDTDIIVAIGNAKVRKQFLDNLITQKRHIPTLIHPTAIIAPKTEIGKGSVIMAGAVINPHTTIGVGCIINTGASVDHDNTIGNYVHISVGTHLAGTVSVGDATWIGIGAIISNNISICENCTIGAGCVVVKDLDVSGVYVGVPAKLLQK